MRLFVLFESRLMDFTLPQARGPRRRTHRHQEEGFTDTKKKDSPTPRRRTHRHQEEGYTDTKKKDPPTPRRRTHRHKEEAHFPEVDPAYQAVFERDNPGWRRPRGCPQSTWLRKVEGKRGKVREWFGKRGRGEREGKGKEVNVVCPSSWCR